MIGSLPRKEKIKRKNSKYWRTHAQGQYDASTDGANVIAAKKFSYICCLRLKQKATLITNHFQRSLCFCLFFSSSRFGGQLQQCGK